MNLTPGWSHPGVRLILLEGRPVDALVMSTLTDTTYRERAASKPWPRLRSMADRDLDLQRHAKWTVRLVSEGRQVIICTGCQAIISGEFDQEDSVRVGPRSSRAHAGSQGWPFRAGSVFFRPQGDLPHQAPAPTQL
jgi:hypothetical protein